MKKIVFKGPFSMPIMEDSTNLSDTVVSEVMNDDENNHKYDTTQELVIKEVGDKKVGHLIIKTRLKFNS